MGMVLFSLNVTFMLFLLVLSIKSHTSKDNISNVFIPTTTSLLNQWKTLVCIMVWNQQHFHWVIIFWVCYTCGSWYIEIHYALQNTSSTNERLYLCILLYQELITAKTTTEAHKSTEKTHQTLVIQFDDTTSTSWGS